MKLPFAVVAMLLASLLVLASVDIAEAQWDALSSGFAVTTNYHGIDVPIGQPVTATAGWAPALIPDGNPAKSIEVRTVEFVWHYPDGTVAFSETKDISEFSLTTPQVPPGPIPKEIVDWANQHDGSDPKYPQITYWYANDTKIPNVLGDWGVQAIFHNTVKICGKNSDIVRIRATSFNVVPEVPFGTIVILLSWIGVLGVFAVKKKHLLA